MLIVFVIYFLYFYDYPFVFAFGKQVHTKFDSTDGLRCKAPRGVGKYLFEVNFVG